MSQAAWWFAPIATPFSRCYRQGETFAPAYVPGYDTPGHLTAILRAGHGLLIYNVAEQRLMTVALGVVLDWFREAGI